MQLSGSLKRVMPFLFAGVMGLLAVFVFEQYRQRLLREVEQERQKLRAEYEAPVDVIVAKQDIPAGKALAEADLAVASIPGKFVQPYATRYGGDLLGLVAIAPIAQGEQILRNKLRTASELAPDATLSGLTPEGKRAVTIGSDALNGVGGFVRPGDRIDILWTVKLPEAQGNESVTMTLFQNVTVLAVGNEMIGKATSEKESAPDYTVTLSLTPQETSLLYYARAQGQIQLSLRPRTDKSGQVAIAPASGKTLMESLLGKQAGTGTPKPQRTVEVYKGLERSVVSVNE